MGSFEAFTKPSMTEPDNTMSIPEIIARYTRGQGLGVNAFPWQPGVAPEDGEAAQNDGTLESVLGMEEPADASADPAPSPEPQPAAPAAAPAAASSASPAPATPVDTGAPAGA